MPRIGLIQMRCEKGAIDENLATIARYLEEATSHDVDFVGFPEMSLTGYVNPAKCPEARLTLDGPEVAQFLKLTEQYSATVMVGLIEANPAGKPFITQIVARQGVLQGHYHKITIKDEETNWFSPGHGVPVFQSDGVPFGVAICADIENEAVFAECARQGAKIVFELAAPGLYGEQATRNWESGYQWWEGECQKYLSRYAQKYGLWIGVATQAGRTIDEDFPGGGYVFSPAGERLYATAGYMPGAEYLQVDFEKYRVVNL
ncbi:MAG: carbon-nitrogen hydrolase family protein [Anaerolineae bacterium]|nr:carbon-nitrogen hydrolase family protein [Anaerolineae bacterium]